jgi:hypothetical protein
MDNRRRRCPIRMDAYGGVSEAPDDAYRAVQNGDIPREKQLKLQIGGDLIAADESVDGRGIGLRIHERLTTRPRRHGSLG